MFLRFLFRCVYYKITFQKMKSGHSCQKKRLRKTNARESFVERKRIETKHKVDWNDLGIVAGEQERKHHTIEKCCRDVES